MRKIYLIIAFLSLTMAGMSQGQNVITFDNILTAKQAIYLGEGFEVQTRGYYEAFDGGAARYKVVRTANAPGAVDSGYVLALGATKRLVQIIEDNELRAQTFGVKCGDITADRSNYFDLQNAVNTAIAYGYNVTLPTCRDTVYVEFAASESINIPNTGIARTITIQGATKGMTVFQPTGDPSYNWFSASDTSKVRFVDVEFIGNFDPDVWGGIGGKNQALSISNDTLTITGGNSVVLPAGGGGGTDDQLLSIDSNSYKYTISIEDGNSVTIGKSQDNSTSNEGALSVGAGNAVSAQIISNTPGSSPISIQAGTGITINETVGVGGNINIINQGDLSSTNELQTITLDSVSGTYNLSLSNGGGSVKIKRDTDTDDQTLSIDSNATTYTLTIVDGNNVKFAKGGGGGGGGSPGGNNNDIQFNRSSSFTGTDSLEWVGASGELKVLGRINTIFNASSIAIGSTALVSDDGNNFNIGIGEGALADVTSGTANIAIGYFAGENMTTQTNCVAIGQFALRNNTGSSNFGIGPSSLLSATGSENTAIGHSALQNNTSGARGTSIGTSAMLSNTTGSDNTAVGQEALRNNTTTSFNTAVGRRALRASAGSYNTSFGWYGLNEITSGSQNVALGAQSGRFYGASTSILTTANDVVLIGYDSRPSANSASNEIVIGSQSRGNGNNTATYGNTSITDHYFNGTVRSSGAYIGRVTTFNSTPSQTTFGAYICHVDYTTTGAFSLVIDTDNLVSGYTLIIKDVDGNAGSNNITISTEGAETIDGSSTYVISTNYGSVQLYSDGVNWYTF